MDEIKEKHIEGLSAQQVEESRKKYGENILTPPKREPLWKLFLQKFDDPIIRILIVAALLTLGISSIHGDYAETIGIIVAIFLSTFIGFWFEVDANKKFDVLNKVNDDTTVRVIREGKVTEIKRKDVVVGDIVILETGEEIPADGELLQSTNLRINESTLTGEQIVSKSADTEEADTEATYPTNHLYRGTSVIEGHGTMEVRHIGDDTEYGKVAREATIKNEQQTPLDRQLDRLAKLISVVGMCIAFLTFGILLAKEITSHPLIYGHKQLYFLFSLFIASILALTKIWIPILYGGITLLKPQAVPPRIIGKINWLVWILAGFVLFAGLIGIDYLIHPEGFEISQYTLPIDAASRILQYFMVAVTLIVSAVPEGLPMSVTLSLALSMRRMLQSNNLVRKMHACETMGATTVICTDKTGTLTKNRMEVRNTRFFAFDKAKELVIEGIAANTTAHLDYTDPKHPHAIGNPTEGALLLWLHSQNTDYLPIRENARITDQLTFSTERKYMATIVKCPTGESNILYVKGAPEIILGQCHNVYGENGNEPIGDHKKEIEAELLSYQLQAMRTLAFAYKEIKADDNRKIPNIIKDGLTFLGFVAIADPVREDVPAAVDCCLKAGINVKIVTGDTTATAREIGRQIGIWKEQDGATEIITGPEFGALSDQEAAQRVNQLKIMCRARPTDKQRLVKLLQQSGNIVAVTGDGTNDAPALNFADVGLSMGSGTSVAKEASDITLLDDSFASITTAVMWGRSIYQNIQRFILFQLTINVVALMIVFIGSILGKELPITITQMLWINLIMDTFAAGALASLPPNPKVMKYPPRQNSSFIVTPKMGMNILISALFFIVTLLGILHLFTNEQGDISRYNLSMFFTIFVMFQFWNLFNAKAFLSGQSAFKQLGKSKVFVFVALLILAGQWIIVTFGGDVFRTVPLSLKDWGIIIGGTSIVLWIGEILRLIANKRK
ncbi:MAG: calcium-translocating P-type ATPase, PMCA-type [Bacteroidales bacterium]|nr:calcium-translocating P-type ATPase, PMCA-type [Bacteroidales bacterium]